MPPRSLAALFAAALSTPLGWARSLLSAHRARRRLRAYGPAAILAIGQLPRLRAR